MEGQDHFLLKALQRLKQASRFWRQHFRWFPLSIGFPNTYVEPSSYTGKDGQTFRLIVLQQRLPSYRKLPEPDVKDLVDIRAKYKMGWDLGGPNLWD